ncbi:DUF1294 domain-containing protein [Halobacillus campisalis]|uniref:DUF1294 domain-containing protein n=1 Tax=Halobacillus campisalis TaxID=435909 RepID=A0ABW2K2Y2_9BACI|nr:DUF1294 domain-containing protein [Halobacillus campisalis]
MVYFLLINILLFFVVGYDKRQARKRKRRISEKNLWVLALIGGALGGVIGMQVYRHKTKHSSFKYGWPALAAIQLVILSVLFSSVFT